MEHLYANDPEKDLYQNLLFDTGSQAEDVYILKTLWQREKERKIMKLKRWAKMKRNHYFTAVRRRFSSDHSGICCLMISGIDISAKDSLI